MFPSVTFVSEPAKYGLIAGVSSSPACCDIIQAIVEREAAAQTWTWVTRVPTESNCADEPSRLMVGSAAARFNATIHWPRLPSSLKGGLWVD
eukprot:2363677-Amphidinium_carterae.1